jgi:hypothetical protein
MSETPPPGVPPPLSPRLPPEERSGCVTAILIVIGIILLLPGLCSLFFVFGGLVKSSDDLQIAIALGVVGCTGVFLIWLAIWGRK